MEFVRILKSRVDIVKVIGESIPLRASGPNRFVGICPFHPEESPSFTVHAVHQFYKCFSCGASGDVITFLMKKKGIDFPEALRLLALRDNGVS